MDIEIKQKYSRKTLYNLVLRLNYFENGYK